MNPAAFLVISRWKGALPSGFPFKNEIENSHQAPAQDHGPPPWWYFHSHLPVGVFHRDPHHPQGSPGHPCWSCRWFPLTVEMHDHRRFLQAPHHRPEGPITQGVKTTIQAKNRKPDFHRLFAISPHFIRTLFRHIVVYNLNTHVFLSWI